MLGMATEQTFPPHQNVGYFRQPSCHVWILVVSALCSVMMVAWVLSLARFGVEFADEGFYLNWISQPAKYGASVSQFGFVYHPLYQIVGGDVALLRKAGLLLTYILAWIAAATFVHARFGRTTLTTPSLLVVSGGMACASFAFLRLWLPTPNYNWLNFDGLLIAVTGAILASGAITVRSIFGWVILGLGGGVVFLAKPSSAAALGFFSLLYIVGARKFNLRLLGVAVGASVLLILIFALIVDGSPVRFIARLSSGFSDARELSDNYQFFALFRSELVLMGSIDWFTWAICFAVTLTMILLARSQAAIVKYLWVAVFIFWSCVIVAVTTGNIKILLVDGPTANFVFLTVILASMLGANIHWVGNQNRFSADSFSSLLALFAFFLSFTFAFGSGNNYWFMAALVSFFWILAAVAFVNSLPTLALFRTLLSFSLFAQFIGASGVLLGANGPYYQPGPITAYSTQIQFGPQEKLLMVDADYGRYFSTAKHIASQAGFVAGTPLIDLTGRSPGLVFGLGAVSPGVPWFYGRLSNARNADSFARLILGRMACKEFSASWLLLEPDGPLSLSPSVIQVVGADLSRDFVRVGVFETPAIGSGVTERHQQELYKPKRLFQDSILQCNNEKG